MSIRKRLLTLVGIFAVLGLLAPFLWWQFLGPERFDDLQLGAVPTEALNGDDFAGMDDDGARLANLAEDSRDADGQASAQQAKPIELPPLTMSSTTRVTLIFSVGSNGMTQREANRLRVADIGDRGGDKLTDSMLLLISDPATDKAALLSVPRDLWLSHRGHRINESFVRRGVQALVDDVSRAAGIPVHHVVQVNFTAFGDLVSAVDGVALQVKAPVADLHSTLYVPEPGCWRFGGADALAWARSRKPLTTRNGGETWRNAAGGNDFTRMARQQGLLIAAWDQVRGPGFAKRVPALLDLARGMTIDSGLGLGQIKDLASAFSDVAAGRVKRYILPTVDRRVGAAQVLAIDWRRAIPLYEVLRAWPGVPAPQAAAEPSSKPSAEPSAEPSPSASPTPTPSPSSSSGGSGGVGGALGEVVGGDEPSEQPSSSPSSKPSPSPTPTQPKGSSDESATPTVIGGCSKANSWELPPNPLDYLHQISKGDPTSPYTPTRTADRGNSSRGQQPSQPSPSPSSSPSPSPSPSESADESQQTAPEPDPSPTGDEVDPASDPDADSPSEPADDASDEPSDAPTAAAS